MQAITGLDGAGEDDDKAPPASAAAVVVPPRHQNRISLLSIQWALHAHALHAMLLDMPHTRVIPKRALTPVDG